MSTLTRVNLNNQKGAVHLLLPLIVLGVISLFTLDKIQTTVKFNDADIQGIIAKSNENNPGRSPNEIQKGPLVEVKLKQEIRTSDEKIKTEFKQDHLQLNTSRVDTKSIIKKQGNEINIKTEIKKIKINDAEDEATKSAGKDKSEVIQEVRATSKFPLRIDVTTNQLIMTKNGVERILTTLPAQAVQNMLRAHLKKGLGPKFFQATSTPSASISPSTPTASPSGSPDEEPIATESANVTILEDKISLEEENGQIIYKIPAKKHLRLFGLIPVTTDLTGIVSAQTGVLIEEKQSLLSRILNLLSP